MGTQEHGIKLKLDLSKGLDCWCDADFAGLWRCEDDQDPVSISLEVASPSLSSIVLSAGPANYKPA